MRLLLATPRPPASTPPPPLATEVTCAGPDWPDLVVGSQVFALAAPTTHWELAPLLPRLPAHAAPDVFACVIDARRPQLVRHTRAFAGPRLALLAHLDPASPPSPGLLAYLTAEAFDHVVVVDDARPAQALRAAGFPTHWWPGLLLPPTPFAPPPLATRPAGLVARARTPAAARALAALAGGDPFEFYGPEDDFDGWTSVAHALLAPDRSDILDTEYLAALAAGSLLLARRPDPAGGFTHLFPESETWLGFTDRAELAALRATFPTRPAELRRIAAAGLAATAPLLGDRPSSFASFVRDGVAPVTLPPGPFIPSAPAPPAHSLDEVWTRLCHGDYATALARATTAVADPALEIEARLILAELAREAGHAPLLAKHLAALPPEDPRTPYLRHPLPAPRLPARLARAQPTPNLAQATHLARLAPRCPVVQRFLAAAHLAAGDLPSATTACIEALRYAPGDVASWLHLATLHDRQGQAPAASAALARAAELDPAPTLTVHERPRRDLLVCGSEMGRQHGTGILMQRAFPDSTNFVVLRSATLYQGDETFGGSHLVLPGAGLADSTRARRLRRFLAPFPIGRILCVPFGPDDFHHAILAQRHLGVPLATWVMDDQAAYTNKVPADLARDLFQRSDLRLAISPEMAAAYLARFGTPCDLLPPLVNDLTAAAPNTWTPAARPAHHGIMIGNVWSLAQFARLHALVQATGLVLDWYGNPDLVLSRYDRDQLARDGIHCRGSVSEPLLAARLATFPFTLVLTGRLDGTENNEWLSRLSLPSRMVFILTHTHTPMLVVGHADTCAARFATGLGIGLQIPYEIAPLRRALAHFANPRQRDPFVARARAVTPAFVHPRVGDWLWSSLAAGRALPTAFAAALPLLPPAPQPLSPAA